MKHNDSDSSEHEYDDIINPEVDNVKMQKNPAYRSHKQKQRPKSQPSEHLHSSAHSTKISQQHSHSGKKKHENIIVATGSKIDEALRHITNAKHRLDYLHSKSKESNNIKHIVIAILGIIEEFNTGSDGKHQDQAHIAIVRINKDSLIACLEYFKQVLQAIEKEKSREDQGSLRYAHLEISRCKHIIESILKTHQENK